MPLTDKEYVDKAGAGCPHCLCTTNVTGHSVSIDRGVALQDCSCSNCGAQWVDQYSLVGFETTEEPTPCPPTANPTA